MRIKSLVLAIVAVTGLSAQDAAERGEARIQIFGEVMTPRRVNYAGDPQDSIQFKAAHQEGVGLRFMGEWSVDSGWFYEIGGRFDNSSKCGFPKATVVSGHTYDVSDMNFEYGYWTLGVGRLWRMNGLSLGAHLEGRGEFLRLTGTEKVDGVATGSVRQGVGYLRPWVRLSADYSFRLGKLRPFIGVDGALPIIRTSQNWPLPLTEVDDRMVKAMAPTWSASVYGGIIF